MKIIPVTEGKEFAEFYLFRINPGIRIIYLLILVSVVAVLCCLPFIYVDISIQARGFLQPGIEKQTLYAPAGGKIKYTSIKSGSKVRKGDTLFIIDSETIKAQREALIQRINENNASMEDLRRLAAVTSGDTILFSVKPKLARYIAQLEDLRKQYSIQCQKYQKAEKDHIRNTVLFNERLIPLSEFEATGFTCEIEKENLRRILMTGVGQWHYEMSQRKTDSARMVAELDHYNEELEIRTVRAPVGGEIISSSELQAGGIVLANQKVADISPDGVMIANVFVKPADIGFIKKGQKVKIQVDAFNFNEWGMLEGEITDISDDLYIEDNLNPFFRVRCMLKSGTLSLKNGYEARVRKGMSITTRVIVTRRSVFNLLFDKVSKWFNPYMNNRDSE